MGHVVRALCTVLFGYAAIIIGSLSVFIKRLDPESSFLVLAASLPFNGGILLYVSLVHLYPGALMQFVRSGHAIGLANLYTWLSFLSGFIAVYLIEMVIWFIHDTANAKRDLENQMVQEEPEPTEDAQSALRDISFNVMNSPRKVEATKTWRIRRTDILIATVIGLRNFPEGMVAYTAVSLDPDNATVHAFSLGLRDLFEGILVVLPIYFATGSRRTAFLLALAAATLEPMGALTSWLFMSDGLTGSAFGIILGLIGGIEVCLTLKELLPIARQGDMQDHYVSIFSLLGMLAASFGYAVFAFAFDEKSLQPPQ